MKRVAICLRGAVSKISGTFTYKNQLYEKSPYINLEACYNSIHRHIIKPNRDYSFDFFIHSWNPDLKERLINIYNPKKFLFEDNNLYAEEIEKKIVTDADFGGISQALSIKKSIELIEGDYDVVIIYRPDVFLWKDMILEKYLPENIYVNAHVNFGGDFHFVMTQENANKFKDLYDSVELGNKHEAHVWIKNYVINYMKKNLLMDNIQPGLHQEVMRKIFSISCRMYGIHPQLFMSYGLTFEELITYNTLP